MSDNGDTVRDIDAISGCLVSFGQGGGDFLRGNHEFTLSKVELIIPVC